MYFRHTEVAAASAAAVAPSELTRRQFLRLTTLAGSGLTLGILMPGCGTGPGGAGRGAGAASEPLAMPFLAIAPDNTVTVISKHLEAGQGVWTGLPAIVAEELDASWEQMPRRERAGEGAALRQPGTRSEGRRAAHRGLDLGRELLAAAAPGGAPRRAPCW